MNNLHQATTFNEVLNIEGNAPSKTKTEEVKQSEDEIMEPNQIDSSSKNWLKGDSQKNVRFGDFENEDGEEEEDIPVSINDMIKKTEELAISND